MTKTCKYEEWSFSEEDLKSIEVALESLEVTDPDPIAECARCTHPGGPKTCRYLDLDLDWDGPEQEKCSLFEPAKPLWQVEAEEHLEKMESACLCVACCVTNPRCPIHGRR